MSITGKVPLVVAFSDDTTGETPEAWSWTFGDGGSDGAQNPVYGYLTPGTYDVSLTIYIGDDAYSTTKVGYVIVTDS